MSIPLRPALAALVVGLLAAPGGGEAAPVSFDEFVVTGEYLKPEITVVMSRENLNKAYELKLDESFLEKIVESVERPPF